MPSGYTMAVRVLGEAVAVTSTVDLLTLKDFANLPTLQVLVTEAGHHSYNLYHTPLNAFVLRHLAKKLKASITPEDAESLREKADRVVLPTVTLAENNKHLEIVVPNAHSYKTIVKSVGGWPVKDGGYRVNISRIIDLETLCGALKTFLPPVAIDPKVKALTTAPIMAFDGTLESLKAIPVGELNLVKANQQTYKATSKSSKTLEEKLQAFGISTLYDLLLWFPKRYIDKSQPQSLDSLMIDEPATVVGEVTSVDSIPGNTGGAAFTIALSGGGSIRSLYWRQSWLMNKFKLGDEVLATGKYTKWQGTAQLGGSSIELATEAALLPIVPIYRQSESKGITTAFLLSAVRELFSRLGPIRLPSYLQGEGRMDYYEAYRELHLPTTLAHHDKVIDSLAYYELVYMQLLLQEQREYSERKPGISLAGGERGLQRRAEELLPFTLTESQRKGMEKINRKFSATVPSSLLLNADVGAGKSVCAFLASLQAVDAGYQVVLLAPTEVLARQLYAGALKMAESLSTVGEQVTVEYMGRGMKVREKKALLKRVEEQEVDILVGTLSVVGTGVRYKNLGLVVIDEQQKFGAEQRSALLQSREDGRVPHVLQASATPIPRSTAQAFYGDIDMIFLKDKPPGRLPIATEWLEENPAELLDTVVHPLWEDLMEEAKKGNQTFIVTPLVEESQAVDAASVKAVHKLLKERVFPELRVGVVHGQMKSDDLRETMEAFRAKAYDIIVASTVVEVGVDIPDATRMVVLSADRFGASSLHQIRGRVGRNSKPSKCYLVSATEAENSRDRLRALVEHDDGFEVAKADLKARGTGSLFGASQSGASDQVFANIFRHGAWTPKAREEALLILSSKDRGQALADAHSMFTQKERLL